jgi:ATP/maltotriose-dependent transcriptional regulator MalT
MEQSLSTLAGTAARLARPQISAGRLARPQLEQALAAALSRRLTIVQAPAGYGKTGLAAVVPAGRTALWVSLDRNDDDLLRFALVLAAAFRAVLPDVAGQVAAAAAGGQADAAFALLTDGLQALTAETVIVLDDLHHLQQPAVHQRLAALIDGGPPQLHWLLLSRHAVGFSISRLILAEQCTLFDMSDLRLSAAEVADYLAAAADLTIDPSALLLLTERTQGWLAGIKLAILSWQRSAGALTDADAPAQLPRHAQSDNRLLAEYLTDEVLAAISPPLRSFLLLCAIPDRLHPELCAALTDQPDSAALLEQAYRHGLFLQPAATLGEWYEMHALFRELLLVRLKREHPRAELQAAAQRAAGWLAARGDVVSALHCLTQVAAHAAAADLVAVRARIALAGYRLVELNNWLQLLEPPELERRPLLLIARAWLQFLSGEIAAMPATLAAARHALTDAADAQQSTEVDVLTQVQQIAVGEKRAIFGGLSALAPALAQADAWTRGWADYLTALCFQPDLAPQQSARGLLQQSRRAFADAGAHFAELYVRVAEVMLVRNSVPPEQLAAACRDGMRVARANLNVPAAHEALESFAIIGGEALFWMDRIAEARDLFQIVYDDARLTRNTLYLRQSAIWLTICRQADHHEPTPPEADSWHTDLQLAQLARGERAIILHLSTLLLLTTRMPARHLVPQLIRDRFALLQLSLADVTPSAPDSVSIGVLTAALVMHHDLPQTEQVLRQAIAAAETRSAARTVLHLQILHVLCLRLQGRHQAARAELRRLLPAIGQLQYYRLPLLFPELLPILRSIDHDIAGVLVEHAAHDQTPPAVGLIAQEMTILQLLSEQQSIAEIARTLVVAPSTVKWYLTRIYRKIGVENRRKAIAWFAHYRAGEPLEPPR